MPPAPPPGVQLSFEVESKTASRDLRLREKQSVCGLSATKHRQLIEVFAEYEYGSHVTAGDLYIGQMLVRECNDQR
jgi:hypothetical protein